MTLVAKRKTVADCLRAYGEVDLAQRLPTASEAEFARICERAEALAYRGMLFVKAFATAGVEVLEGHSRPLKQSRRLPIGQPAVVNPETDTSTDTEMRRRVRTAARASVNEELGLLGFEARGGVLWKPINDEVTGWVGVGDSGSKGQHFSMTANVGVRHDALERLENPGLRPGQSAPTLLEPLYWLMGREESSWWVVHEDGLDDVLAELMSGMRSHGIPWMEQHASLEKLLEEFLAKPKNPEFWRKTPIALHLLGRDADALEFLDRTLRDVAGDNPVVAARYREFAARLRPNLEKAPRG